MKRILSLILCVLMLVPCLAVIASAEEYNDEYRNFAIDDTMGSYASSIWNNDSQPKFINNDVLEDSYRFWRPDSVGRNPAIDDKMQYCGLKSSGQYYEVREVVIYHDYNGADNDILYTIKALVLGEWITIGSARDSETEKDVGKDRKNVGRLVIDVQDVVTKEIRLECSEWGRWSTANQSKPESERWHDWWKVPIIHELQTWGVESPPPPWDVPDGAVLSTNACLGGMSDASSINTMAQVYPALAVDDNKLPTASSPKTYWQAGTAGAGQSVWTMFDRPYDIENVTANFGGSVDGVTMKYDVQVCVNGVWEYIAQNLEVTSSVAQQDDVVISEFDPPKNVEGVKFIFTEVSGGSGAANRNRAILTEMGALIDNDYKIFDEERGEMVEANKCVFLRDYMTANRKQSTGAGNLAIFGTAYASSVMSYSNISNVAYINDGGIQKNEDYSWFASSFVKGTYCGVTLKDTYNVDKIVLYFNDPVTDRYVYGNNYVSDVQVMEFDIQAKVDGEFKTIKTGVTSYDQTKREYVVSVQLDAPVATDDIRIVYTSNAMVFPYIKELEVYSSEFLYRGYLGYQIGLRANGGKAGNLINDFAAKTLIPRSSYLDKISPIQYFEVTKNFDIKVLAWI